MAMYYKIGFFVSKERNSQIIQFLQNGKWYQTETLHVLLLYLDGYIDV